MGYLLSIMVPTKNRYQYLKHFVELLISFETDDIELVIQDNSDNNEEFLSYIQSKQSSKEWIKYYHKAEFLTSIENFDLALKHCTGEYICFIGDDDGVVSNIVDYVKWMKANNIDALRCVESQYIWPAYGKYSSYLKVNSCSGSYEFLDPQKELIRVLKAGCSSLGNMPVIYTGIVRAKVMEEIFSNLGTYFPGNSADMASAVALCFYVKKYVKVYTPVVITGTSKMTGGGIQKMRLVKLEEVPFIKREMIAAWEPIFPKYWTGMLVWPESCVNALRKLNKESFIKLLNVDAVMANFYFANRSYKNEALAHCQNKFKFFILYVFNHLKWFIQGSADRLIRIVSGYKKCLGGTSYYNIANISQAEKILKAIDAECSIIDK